MISLIGAIQNARGALAALKRYGGPAATAKSADQLMEAIWHIGTWLYSTASGDEPPKPPELEAFIADTAGCLYEAESGLSSWLFHVQGRCPEDDGSYRSILRDRSAAQFLRDLYKATEAFDYIAELDTESFDQDIRSRADQYNVGTPPRGVPRHHWWWWAT